MCPLAASMGPISDELRESTAPTSAASLGTYQDLEYPGRRWRPIRILGRGQLRVTAVGPLGLEPRKFASPRIRIGRHRRPTESYCRKARPLGASAYGLQVKASMSVVAG